MYANLNDTNEKRNVITDSHSPEVLTNNIYTPAFLREQIGKLIRVEFLIGTNNLTDRTGILEDVGVSYILLRSIECGNLLYCVHHSFCSYVFISVYLQASFLHSNLLSVLPTLESLSKVRIFF